MIRIFVLLLLAALLSPSLSCAHDAALPSRDPKVVLPLLKKFNEHSGNRRVVEILGKPDDDLVSGFSIRVYRLTDSTSIYVKSTSDHGRIMGISRTGTAKTSRMIYEPLIQDEMTPPVASAPF